MRSYYSVVADRRPKYKDADCAHCICDLRYNHSPFIFEAVERKLIVLINFPFVALEEFTVTLVRLNHPFCRLRKYFAVAGRKMISNRRKGF